MNDDETSMPILGESIVIDFANTWYIHPDGVIDYLADISTARAWLRLADVSVDTRRPTVRGGHDLVELRDLRSTVRTICDAVADGQRPQARHVADLNRHASAARCDRVLEWRSDGEARVEDRYSGDLSAVLRSHLAHETITVLASGAALRRCEHPTCSMLFVRDHRKRRFCHPGCSHRDRQARYSLARRQHLPSWERSR